ncbi:MAG: peptidylprolyl isomerase [Phycisphaerales bacterium]|nr:peptidylprolyl isomerase [Phycisphaerales bacterium]
MNDPTDKLAEKLRGAARMLWTRRAIHALLRCALMSTLVAPSCQSAKQSDTIAPLAAKDSAAEETSTPKNFSQSIIPARPLAQPEPIVATSSVDTIAKQNANMARSTLAKSAALECARRFHRAKEPVEIRVVAPSTHGQLTIQVLDTDGKSLGDLGVTPGIVDLRPLIPTIDSLSKSAWVQLFEDGKPIASPIVLEPLRSPPSVRTQRAQRKGTNDAYTRIVGWGDRLLDPADQEVVIASAQWIPSEPVVLSGFRTELDVDAMVMTDAGPIRIAFATDAAPATVRNFVTLADQGFYNNTIFHRIVPMNREGQPFVIQGGDPTGTGDGGPGWNLALEPSDLPHDIGVVGMARGDDPNSAGSQFYIALSRAGTARLDGQYCTFGYVVSGREAMGKIAAANIADAATGRPTTAPKIQEVIIVAAPPRIPGENRRAQRIRSEVIDTPNAIPTSPQSR